MYSIHDCAGEKGDRMNDIKEKAVLNIGSNKEIFSVIIPSYLRVFELERAINSILIQHEFVQKIIVVDDKSDNIEEIRNAIKKIDNKKILLIENDFKSNAAYTRNQGARLAKTEWICFLDSDDIFLPKKLAKVYNAINSTDEVDVIYTQAKMYYNDYFEKNRPDRPLNNDEHISEYIFCDNQMMQTSTLTIRSNFFHNHGFNENLSRHQDYDLALKFSEVGAHILYLEFPGTAIYWYSKNGPQQKGESVEYSYQWLLDNANRMTKKARNDFYYYYVVLKAARHGRKKEALKFYQASTGMSLSIKQYFIFWGVMLCPHSMYQSLFDCYKKNKSKFNTKQA